MQSLRLSLQLFVSLRLQDLILGYLVGHSELFYALAVVLAQQLQIAHSIPQLSDLLIRFILGIGGHHHVFRFFQFLFLVGNGLRVRGLVGGDQLSEVFATQVALASVVLVHEFLHLVREELLYDLEVGRPSLVDSQPQDMRLVFGSVQLSLQ